MENKHEQYNTKNICMRNTNLFVWSTVGHIFKCLESSCVDEFSENVDR